MVGVSIAWLPTLQMTVGLETFASTSQRNLPHILDHWNHWNVDVKAIPFMCMVIIETALKAL